MKIVGERRTMGSHAVRLLAETSDDEKVLLEWFKSIRARPVLRGTMLKEAADDFNSLLLEELP
jgi:hypothetical protein